MRESAPLETLQRFGELVVDLQAGYPSLSVVADVEKTVASNIVRIEHEAMVFSFIEQTGVLSGNIKHGTSLW